MTPPPRLILWPEHFDIAVELGSEPDGHRATYGFSPGDEHHPRPYVYVGPWVTQDPGELWQARGFPGAELGYSELLAAGPGRGRAGLLHPQWERWRGPTHEETK